MNTIIEINYYKYVIFLNLLYYRHWGYSVIILKENKDHIATEACTRCIDTTDQNLFLKHNIGGKEPSS